MNVSDMSLMQYMLEISKKAAMIKAGLYPMA